MIRILTGAPKTKRAHFVLAWGGNRPPLTCPLWSSALWQAAGVQQQGSSCEGAPRAPPVRAAPIRASAGMRSLFNVLSKFCATYSFRFRVSQLP